MDGPLTLRQRRLARGQGGLMRAILGLPPSVLRLFAGPPLQLDGQELDVGVQLMLRLIALQNPPQLDELSVPEARRRVATDVLGVAGVAPADVVVRSVAVPGPDGPLDARLFVPPIPSGGLLVYFHGGGFVVLDADAYAVPCSVLARASGAHVLSIDYRRAPEHRFPAAAEDAWAAYRYAAEHAAEFGGRSGAVSVGGDSAGGNLAAGVAQRAVRDGGPAPAMQLLIYPWLDLSTKRPSRQRFADGFYLTDRDLDWYTAQYLSRPEDALDPACSPLLAEDLSGVAPAYIMTAGFDPLRDEGEEYARRLQDVGVLAALTRQAGLVHGFASALGAGRAGLDALLPAAGALRLAVGGVVAGER